MAKIINQTHRRPYGNCALCGYCGSVQYHHIVPKRYKIKTDIKTRFVYADDDDNKLRYTEHKARIEHLMIQLCDKCHKKMHPENWAFIMNSIAMEKERQLSLSLNSSKV